MLAIIISWIAISIVFLSFGDIIVTLYNKLCKRNEAYGITDTFLLGMCFTLFPLSLSSLWLPSNHYILLAYLIISIGYWSIRKKHFFCVFEKIKTNYKSLSLLQLFVFIIPIISLSIVILWQVGVFDSLLYHQQNIRWNEEYAVVPGLGNIEHRFGFNSNYLLLSGIFSLRFLFGEGVYSLQVLVLVYVICWTIKEIVISGYEIKRILLLVVITGYIFTFGYSLTATSTDAIPNIITLYLIAKILLYPNCLKSKLLLFVLVPISLVTFKLTIVPLCLISLYLFISLIRSKEYKTILLLTTISSIIIILWLIRNVIISGYLVFPFYEIDLLSVDWKVPHYIAVEERDFILSCGIRVLHDIFWQLNSLQFSVDGLRQWLMNFIFIGPTLLSPFIVLYCLVKKSYLSRQVYFTYAILAAIITVWYIGGPDPRFIGGTLFAMVYYILFMFSSTKEEKQYPKMGTLFITSFALLMGYWAISRSVKFYNMFDLKADRGRPATSLFFKQYPYRELLKSAGFYKDKFIPYLLKNNTTIYISKSPEVPNGRFVCFESPFPCSVRQADEPGKYQDISDIETRGLSFQAGFKPLNK